MVVGGTHRWGHPGVPPPNRHPLPTLQASRLILAFDEHVLSNHFKFGVIYQKLGQVWGGVGGG